MKNQGYLFALCILLIGACKPLQQTNDSQPEKTSERQSTLQPKWDYQPARKRIHNLIHTKLDVRFNWEKQYLYGKANLTFTPYFHPTQNLVVDAKGFDIAKVALVDGMNQRELAYEYDSLQLSIDLIKEYTRADTFEIYIEYTAKPEELAEGGSSAITDDQGLYFINPLGDDSTKPQQIWTQGETEASSCWFPTIDAPNENSTQEIYITVDKKYKTLSNGLLQYSTENEDGTRTDYWKQDLPHAPYLFMMAIGDFAVVKDTWDSLDVHYYVEPEYESYARNIFGNTPEMLEFYSKLLGIKYPWEKYHQVVVRDYVSGAMENTSAVIHGEFLQRTDRELLDNNNEDVIAHELFHHWFGDLVTCESWSNLPLNESFATYGEYLWEEYKYGKDAADYHLQGNLNRYLREAERTQVDMIRYRYESREDMFDSHSYSKGGRILHMLRKYVGDDAFFESLQTYLEENKFSTAEIHDLRLAFEKVTGEDLNWFFNQWFLASGHPDIKITSTYNDSLKQVEVIISQRQDLQTTPLHTLPLDIDIYAEGRKARHRVLVSKETEQFTFNVSTKPDLVNVDAEKMLLCVKNEEKPISEWVFQYYNAPLYLDRYEALEQCSTVAETDSLAALVILDALSDPYWNLRLTAIRALKDVANWFPHKTKKQLVSLARTDKKSIVRANATSQLSARFSQDSTLAEVFKEGIEDMSYFVVSASLNALADASPSEGLKLAKTMEEETNSNILTAIASIYSEVGTDAESPFFETAIYRVEGYSKFGFMSAYERYLQLDVSNETVNRGIDIFGDIVLNGSGYWSLLSGVNTLTKMQKELKAEIAVLEKQKETEKDENTKQALLAKSGIITSRNEKIQAILDELKNDPENSKVLEYYDF